MRKFGQTQRFIAYWLLLNFMSFCIMIFLRSNRLSQQQWPESCGVFTARCQSRCDSFCNRPVIPFNRSHCQCYHTNDLQFTLINIILTIVEEQYITSAKLNLIFCEGTFERHPFLVDVSKRIFVNRSYHQSTLWLFEFRQDDVALIIPCLSMSMTFTDIIFRITDTKVCPNCSNKSN